jgi:hypothetical protein
MPSDTPDTSAETVERLAEFIAEVARYFAARPTGGQDMAHWANVTNAESCRKIAATLRALSVKCAGWKEAFDRSTRLRDGDASERAHLVAEMTKRGLLPVLQEIDREWLAQSAAYAETHAALPEGDRPVDPERDALVAVARAARDVHEASWTAGSSQWRPITEALDALHAAAPGVLDQSSG